MNKNLKKIIESDHNIFSYYFIIIIEKGKAGVRKEIYKLRDKEDIVKFKEPSEKTEIIQNIFNKNEDVKI